MEFSDVPKLVGKSEVINLMKIAVVTVAYNPDMQLFESNLRSYKDQASAIIVADNSTDKEIQNDIKKLCDRYSNVHVITLGNNYGIGRAQNEAFNYGFKQGVDFFLEMDQDSSLPPDYISNAVSRFLECSKDSKLGALGGIAVNKRNNQVYDGYKANTGTIETDKSLSSGMLTSSKVLSDVGLKNEEMFIDLVDWEWCWRAKSKGYKILIDTDISVIHLMGDQHIQFLTWSLGEPSPMRHYYAFRNSLLLLRKKYVPLKWKLQTIGKLGFKLFFYPLILNQGKERFRFMRLGILDSFKSKYGRIDGAV
jgi:rhamnosyltransferase